MPTTTATQQSLVLAIASSDAVTLWNGENQALKRSSTTLDPFPSKSAAAAVAVVDLQWNHTGKVLCCARKAVKGDDSIVLLSAQTGRVLSSFGSEMEPASVQFGGKSRYLCIGGLDGSVVVWDLKKQAEARRFQLKEPCHQACLDPTDEFVYALGESQLSVFRLREATMLTEIKPFGAGSGRSVTCFSISSQFPHYTTVGSQDGRVAVYDLTTASTMQTPVKKWIVGKTPIVQVSLEMASNRLAVASTNRVGVYESSSRSLFEVSMEHESDKLTCMSFSGSLVAVGRESGGVGIWDWKQGKQVAMFRAHTAVHHLVFGPPGATIPTPALTPRALETPQPAPRDSVQSSIPSRPRASPETVATLEAQPERLRLASIGANQEYISVSDVQDIVREEVDRLRDEMQDSFRNLHLDTLREFQRQSKDLNVSMKTQLQAMENRILREENRLLQETNEILQRNQLQQPTDKTNKMSL